MSVLASRPGLRWLVPVSAAVAVLGGGLAIGAITAAADRSLPSRSAADLLVDLQTAHVDGLSGTVVARADLGLPAIPAGGDDLSALLTGTHTLRVWYAAPKQARVALMGTLNETDVITNGTDVWVWSSQENKATHRTLPANEDPTKALPMPMATASGFGMTPDALAKAALALLGPSTEVTTNGSASVAGRDAYELVLKPRDPASLIGAVRLAIDATEHFPLRVAIDARGGGDPAIEVGFTQVSFARPDDSQFAFNPPPGATVVESTEDPAKPDATKPDPAKPDATKPDAKPDLTSGARPPMTVVGQGWTSVLVARLPVDQAAGTENPFGGFVAQLPAVSGTWGSGHYVTGRLFSALLTDDGRILIGAVTPNLLFQAAADPAAKLGS